MARDGVMKLIGALQSLDEHHRPGPTSRARRDIQLVLLPAVPTPGMIFWLSA
jgi:hypothetical protein